MIPAGYKYDKCRGMLRHAWHSVDSNHWFVAALPSPSAVPFTIRCERCDTERRDVIDSNGEVVSRRYVYPVGYKIDQEEGAPKIREFRQQWLMETVREMRANRKAKAKK